MGWGWAIHGWSRGNEGGNDGGNEGEGKDGENKGKKKQENNNGKKNKNKENNKNQKQQARNPIIMARSFVKLRGLNRYSQYQMNFLWLEASNLLTLCAQIVVRIVSSLNIQL